MKLDVLDGTFTPYILDETPLVLSLGKRCLEEGYGFAWPPGGDPVLLRPDNTVIKLKMEGRVPVINENCERISRETAEYEQLLTMAARLIQEEDLLPVTASHASHKQADEEEEEGLEEHGEEEAVKQIKTRTVDELMAEAVSPEHQYETLPKEPFLPRVHASHDDEASRESEGRTRKDRDQEVRRPHHHRPRQDPEERGRGLER